LKGFVVATNDDHASNAPRMVNLDGTDYEMRPLRRIDYKQIVSDAKHDHIELARSACNGSPDAVQIKILGDARQEASLFTLEHPTVQMKLVGFDGLCLVLWLSLRQATPELTYDRVVELLGNEADKQRALQEVKDLHGLDEIASEQSAQKKTKRSGARTAKRKERKHERKSLK